MTLQPGKQATAIHIWHKISRIKDNQKIKFGRNLGWNLIENHMKNIFLQISYTKCGRKTFIQDSFLKHENWAYL